MKQLGMAVVLILLSCTAQARDLFQDDLAGYQIEARIINAQNCTGAAFSDTTLEQFEKALCVFHRSNRSAADTDSVVEMMAQAQTQGLPPVHQQLASLVSGLANCASAQRHLDAFKQTGSKDLTEKNYFCRDRRHSQADFQAIRWNHAMFDYADGLGAGRTIGARIDEMAACNAGVLAPELDAECGLITNLPETEINAFVDVAAQDTIKTYFSGVESPITAMFSRKLKRAEGLLESARGGIDELKKSASGVNAEYAALNKAYGDARDHKMSPIYDRYRSSILGASAILDEFNRWKGGLFLTAENENLLPKIIQRAQDITLELKRVQDSGFKSKAEGLALQMRRLVNGEKEDRATIVSLCKVFYCEIGQRRSMTGFIRACRNPILADNPLCVGQDGHITNGTLSVDFAGPQAISVHDLCVGAGLDASFATVNMAPESSSICLSVPP